MEQAFSFQITPPDPDRLLWQVARALEMRTELVSREKCPRLWVLADRLNRKDRGPLAVRQKRRRRRTILSLINWLLGLILLVPGLMDPAQLLLPMLVGAAAFSAATVVLWACRPTLLGSLSLLTGGLLCIGAWGSPDIPGRVLWLGIAEAAVGVTALLTSRRKTSAPYEREAARLLQDRAAANHLGSACITFSEEGMSIAADGVDAIYQVPYGEITFALETEDLLIIIVSNRATILQKADLITGTFSQLREFLRQQVLYTNIEAPEQAKPADCPGGQLS